MDESRDYRNYRFLGMLSEEASRKVLKIELPEDYNNILMANTYENEYVFGKKLDRSLIRTIHFQNHKRNVGANAWDVSEKQNRSVLAWLAWPEKAGSGIDLYLAADGMIKANKDCSGLFAGFDYLEEIFGLEFLQTDQTETMYNMFCECKKLRSLDLSGFDTSKVTNMKYMFACCENLQNLDVSSFDTSQVTNMESMFDWCGNLQNLDVSSFDTSQVTNMGSMFACCENLQNLDVSSFDTSQVTNMGSMFAGCENLQNLDVSNFDTSKVTDMGDMFAGCDKIERLDVSHFDTRMVKNMHGSLSKYTGISLVSDIEV